MKKGLIVIGYFIFIVSGIFLFIFWLSAMKEWLGLFGVILALIISPGLVIFPIIFWIVEGVFPAFYFFVWGIGIVGLIIAIMAKMSVGNSSPRAGRSLRGKGGKSNAQEIVDRLLAEAEAERKGNINQEENNNPGEPTSGN